MSTIVTPSIFITPEALLEHWQGHRWLTRRVLGAFPEDQLFSFSVGNMRPFGMLVMEMNSMPMVRGVATGERDHRLEALLGVARVPEAARQSGPGKLERGAGHSGDRYVLGMKPLQEVRPELKPASGICSQRSPPGRPKMAASVGLTSELGIIRQRVRPRGPLAVLMRLLRWSLPHFR